MPLSFRRRLAPAVLTAATRILRHPRVPPGLKNRLWRLTQRRFAYLDIRRRARIANGLNMQVSSRPRVEQEILLFGEWEPLFSRYLGARRHPDGIFLDIGANIGYFSLLASPLFGAVHAIEASPSIAARLSAHLADNGLDNVTVHNIAVGGEEGWIDFYKNPHQSGGSSAISSGQNALEARVPVAPLETILEGIDWARVRFIKIDIEGFEHFALRSLRGIYSGLASPVEIFVEFDPGRPGTWAEIEALMPLGFVPHVLQGTYDRHDYLEPGRRTALAPCPAAPEIFCDLLLRRSDPDQPGAKG